jgi:hypothetical protein
MFGALCEPSEITTENFSGGARKYRYGLEKFNDY